MNCGKIKKPNISYFHPFGVQCFILDNKDSLGKFDSKSDEGILDIQNHLRHIEYITLSQPRRRQE